MQWSQQLADDDDDDDGIRIRRSVSCRCSDICAFVVCFRNPDKRCMCTFYWEAVECVEA